jgi:hypothetical protein
VTERGDPKGKRALFETPPVHEEDPITGDPLVGGEPPQGKRALFSAGGHRPGTVTIDCAHCGARSRVSIVDAMVRVLAISVWLPVKRYNRWLQCPNCQRRSWVRVHWLG